MRTALVSTALLVLFFAGGCELVDDSEYEQVKKLKSGQYMLIKSDEVSLLKSQAELGKA